MSIKDSTIAALRSVPGYSYSEAKIDEAIARGLQDGDILMSRDGMTIRVEGATAIARDANGAQVGPAMDLTIQSNADRCLQMYAMACGRLSHGTLA